MTLTKREWILATILACLILLTLGFRLLAIPAYRSWRGHADELLMLDGSRSSALSQSDPRLPADAAEMAKNAVEFFLPRAQTEDFHGYFQRFVQQSGLALVNISISRMPDGSVAGADRVNVRLSLSGTQEQALRFMQSVELEGKAICVESMDMMPSGSAENVNFLISYDLFCVPNPESEALHYRPQPPSGAGAFQFSSARPEAEQSAIIRDENAQSGQETEGVGVENEDEGENENPAQH